MSDPGAANVRIVLAQQRKALETSEGRQANVEAGVKSVAERLGPMAPVRSAIFQQLGITSETSVQGAGITSSLETMGRGFSSDTKLSISSWAVMVAKATGDYEATRMFLDAVKSRTDDVTAKRVGMMMVGIAERPKGEAEEAAKEPQLTPSVMPVALLGLKRDEKTDADIKLEAAVWVMKAAPEFVGMTDAELASKSNIELRLEVEGRIKPAVTEEIKRRVEYNEKLEAEERKYGGWYSVLGKNRGAVGVEEGSLFLMGFREKPPIEGEATK